MKNKEAKLDLEQTKTAICVVGDFKFLYKYLDRFVNNIRNEGKYKGEIVVLTSILCPIFLIPVKNKELITYVRFKRIKFDKKTDSTLRRLDTGGEPNRHIHKNFQWHKVHLFDEKIKKWKYVFYIDINMSIHHDINPVLETMPRASLFANRDSDENSSWDLSDQFEKKHNGYKVLEEDFDLNIKNYFQTGILYYDTEIIDAQTKNEILDLVKKYPYSRTNEQGIMNLYFIFIKKIYKQLPEKVGNFDTYSYWKENNQTIITKQLVAKYK